MPGNYTQEGMILSGIPAKPCTRAATGEWLQAGVRIDLIEPKDRDEVHKAVIRPLIRPSAFGKPRFLLRMSPGRGGGGGGGGGGDDGYQGYEAINSGPEKAGKVINSFSNVAPFSQSAGTHSLGGAGQRGNSALKGILKSGGGRSGSVLQSVGRSGFGGGSHFSHRSDRHTLGSTAKHQNSLLRAGHRQSIDEEDVKQGGLREQQAADHEIRLQISSSVGVDEDENEALLGEGLNHSPKIGIAGLMRQNPRFG
jgi:hypothetical protein